MTRPTLDAARRRTSALSRSFALSPAPVPAVPLIAVLLLQLLLLTTTLATTAGPLTAQEMEVGTWTGTMVPPEGISAPVAFEVVDDSGPAITMTVEGTAPRPLETIVFDGELLTFSFNMGTDVRCELERQTDGSFTGPCSSADMRMGTLTMEPPAG